jgi:hypothetical protein
MKQKELSQGVSTCPVDNLRLRMKMPLWRWLEVARLRPRVCVLVALAMIFSLVASTWASTAHMAPMFPQPQMGMDASADMSDCDRMMQAPKADCPDCDRDKTCADKFCLAKCFKVFGKLLELGPLAAMAMLPPRPLGRERPADWCDPPPPAPPRT